MDLREKRDKKERKIDEGKRVTKIDRIVEIVIPILG